MQKVIQLALIILFIASPLGQKNAFADKFLTNEYTLDFYDFPLIPCDAYGFTILTDAFFGFKEMSFFDPEGNLVKFRVRWTVTGVYKSSLDPTKILSLEPGWGANRWIDVDSGQMVQTGAYTRITAPGWGVLVLGVGQIVINSDGTVAFYNGKSDSTEGDFAKLCAYMASL